MKISIKFELTEQQFEELAQAVGYAEEKFNPETKEMEKNPYSKSDVIVYFLKEHLQKFIELFSKQRILVKNKLEEDEVREKELFPLMDAMEISLE
jgi:hypothetical protein